MGRVVWDIMVVVRPRGEGAKSRALSETCEGLAWSKDTKANRTGCVKRHRMETNFKGENSNIENQNAVRTTVENHRTNDYRSLETRLEAGGR